MQLKAVKRDELDLSEQTMVKWWNIIHDHLKGLGAQISPRQLIR